VFTSQSKRIEGLVKSIFPKPGLFLEIGAWRGEHFSQTAYLERQLGWTGVCVDPFPIDFETRSARVCAKAISADGLPRVFLKVTTDRRHGGDVSYFSGFKDQVMRSIHWPVIDQFCDYEEILVETITFSQLCGLYALPEYIEFLSIDIEGGELEIFQSIDFNSHRFGLIAFEHNLDIVASRAIGEILTAHGYQLLERWYLDDIYIFSHKVWLNNEYKKWMEALKSSTVHNFKDHPMVRRMLGDIKWPGPLPQRIDLELLTRIDNIGRSQVTEISGTALRMIHYAQKVLERDPPSIVEIGGGVGQFYATLRALGYQGEYYIMDLPDVVEFQFLYLAEVERQTGLQLKLRPSRFDFCVSFYALGEFDDDTKIWYIENVVTRCPHGLVIWNPHSGASDMINFPCRVTDERPLLRAGNKQLEW
jgi:hypothetical protein